MEMEKIYPISDVVRKYNVSIHTLRYYEKIGLIGSSRTASNYRTYTQAQLETLEQVLFFRKMGIPIQDIKTIFQTDNKQDILNIIAEHKRQIKDEISSMENMRERIYAFLSQEKKETTAPQNPPLLYESMQTWPIDLSTLREVPRGQGYPATGPLNLQPELVLEEGTEVLRISGETAYAVSEKVYDIPLTIHVTAKIHQRHLYLFFGKCRVYFIKEEDGLSLWLHDYATNCNLFVNRAAVEGRDGYIDITWELLKEKTRIFINDTVIFSLDYVNIYDVELTSRISMGTSRDNGVTVKRVSVQQSNGEVEEIDLARMRWPQSEHSFRNGELVYHNLFDCVAMATDRPFSLPLKIDLTAKIDNTDLRLYYHKGGVILNWELDKMLLRVRDVFSGEDYTVPNEGYITPNEYHTVSWILHKNYTALLVDDMVRFYTEDLPYMEHLNEHPMVDDVRIGTAFGSALTVKSLTVTELK